MSYIAPLTSNAGREFCEESLRRFRVALDHSADAVYLIDRRSMRFVDANATAYQVLGYSQDELLQLGPHDLKPRYTREALAARFDAVAAGEDGASRIETVHRRKDGTEFPVEVVLRAMESGGQRLLIALARDITKHEEVRRRLSESEARFRTLFEHAPLGIAAADADGRYTMVNPAFCAMLGYSAEELLCRTFYDVTHPEDRETNRALTNALYAGELSTFRLEKRYVRKSGEIIWAAVTVARVNRRDGALYTFGVHEDITERRENERLRKAWESEQRDALVREVHHRIKNNVQGVVGLLQQHAARHPVAAPALMQAIAQVNALGIVHGLQSQGAKRNIELLDLVESIAGAARIGDARMHVLPSSGGEKITTALHGDEAVPVALVLNELIYNAIKHGAAGNGCAAVAVERSAASVTVRVRNPGVLPPDFNFERSLGMGTGLGLVRALLPRHGAQLRYRQRDDYVLAELTLAPPVVVANAGVELP